MTSDIQACGMVPGCSAFGASSDQAFWGHHRFVFGTKQIPSLRNPTVPTAKERLCDTSWCYWIRLLGMRLVSGCGFGARVGRATWGSFAPWQQVSGPRVASVPDVPLVTRLCANGMIQSRARRCMRRSPSMPSNISPCGG